MLNAAEFQVNLSGHIRPVFSGNGVVPLKLCFLNAKTIEKKISAPSLEGGGIKV